MYSRNTFIPRDLNVLKAPQLPSNTHSLASTTVTIASPFKSSCADLSSLAGIESIGLPMSAFDHNMSSDEEELRENGVCHGKFASRQRLSREMSIESDDGVLCEHFDLFSNLLMEADRLSNGTGSHIKVQKLTTSKSTPYKTILRRTMM